MKTPAPLYFLYWPDAHSRHVFYACTVRQLADDIAEEISQTGSVEIGVFSSLDVPLKHARRYERKCVNIKDWPASARQDANRIIRTSSNMYRAASQIHTQIQGELIGLPNAVQHRDAFPANHYRAKFGIPAKRLDAARRDGRLPGSKQNGRWFYRLSDVQRLWPDDFE